MVRKGTERYGHPPRGLCWFPSFRLGETQSTGQYGSVRKGTEGYRKVRKSSFRVGQTHKVVRKGTERYGLQASGDRLKAASCKFQAAQATGWKLQATGCRLQAAGCRLQATSCRLQAASYRPQATGPLQATAYKPQATSNRLQATGYKNSLLLVFGSCLRERIPSFLWKKYRAGGGCSYTNRVKKLYVFPVWGRYVHGFLAQVILFTLEPIRIFPSSLSFHYLFTRGPRFGQENATGEDRPQKMNVHDFQLSPSVD